MTRRIELDLHGQGITHIRQALLRKYVGLRTLDLSCNSIARIEGLEVFPELSELKLYSNTIKIIEGLERLSQLSILLLHDNQIHVIGSGLSGQKKLQVIRLDHNKIESITWSDINGCNRLIQLDISDNLVKMFLGRCALEHLEELKVANNQLTTAPDITGCKMLRELDLSGNPLCIDSLSVLTVLKNLKILHINAVGLERFEQLAVLKELEELYAASNKCECLQALPNLYPHLEVLDVRSNCIATIEQLTHLGRMTDLNELLLEGNPVYLSCSRDELVSLLPQVRVNRPTAASSSDVPVQGEDNHTRELSLLLIQAELDLKQYQNDIVARFELLHGSLESEHAGSSCDLVLSVPSFDSTDMNMAEGAGDKPPSRCGSRARLKDALVFASSCDSSAEINKS